MPRRPGGLDPTEINEALAALNSATTPQALEEVLERVPALSSPFLHAILRQKHLELRNSKSPYLESFEGRYQFMFLLLHERWHQSLVMQSRANYAQTAQTNIEPITTEPYAPPFWLALLRELNGALPPAKGPFYDPGTDSEALNAELSEALGRTVTLPPFTATPGSKWGAIVVGCGACDRRRLEVRAYAGDLVIAPELIEPLRELRINASRCPACGATLSYPARVWVMESPGAGDTLATLSCAWRLSSSVFSYQPPPGTKRVEENDRILEIRFEKLLRAVPWPEPEDQRSSNGAVQATMTISYTPEELIHYLDRATAQSDQIPFAMETMIREMTRKVESGILPLHQGIDTVLKDAAMFGGDWPIINPGQPRFFEGPLLGHLFHCLVAEGALRAQSASPDALAMFAALTASSLLALGEGALAEAALARADDSLAQLEPGRSRDLVAAAVSDTRADLLEFLDRYDEAAAIRQQLLVNPDLQSDTQQARMARAGVASQIALGFFKEGHFGQAVNAFRKCIDEWKALIEEAAADQTTTAEMQSRAATHGLSGDYANLGSVFTSLAEDIVVSQIVSMPNLSDQERMALMFKSHSDPIGALQRVNEAFPELESYFGGGFNRQQLISEAHNLLQQALVLSEQVEGWEFAGVQAHRLAVLYYTESQDKATAVEFAERAIRYAARAGDHERLYSSRALLADFAMQQGDGAAAITHLEDAARERIRHDVGLGNHTELEQTAEAFGNAAFQAVAIGADPLRAVMIVESLRAANMAAAIVTGTPMQPGSGQQQDVLKSLNAEREKLRLHLIWNADDKDAQTRLHTVENELDQERERVALRDPRYGRWVDATDVDIAAPTTLIKRLAQLGSKTLWLGVLAVRDQLWSYSADANGAVVQSSSLPSFPDEANRDGWTASLLETFAQAILAPHAARIEALDPDDIIVISVAGALHQIPFAALPWAGRPLCESATLVMVQGFGMLEAALDRPRFTLESFALIGAPKRADLPPLPGAALEIDVISDLLKERNVKVSKGPRATVAALIEAAANHDVVHVACHAVADPSPEQASILMLSPDIRHDDSGDLSEDRIISTVEVRQGAVVNLSGCATGRTEQSSAPLLGGLVPAFLLAGAGSVIASLWPIADAPAAKFQAELYRQILTGARPATALARAQRRCARGELGADTQNITVWAAHVAYGAG